MSKRLKSLIETLRPVIEAFPATSATPKTLTALRESLESQITPLVYPGAETPKFDIVVMASRVQIIPLNEVAKEMLGDLPS